MAVTMWTRVLHFRKLSLSLPSNRLERLKYALGVKSSMYSTARPYAFHPRKKTLEGKDQAFYLTKTVVQEQLPASLLNDYLVDCLQQELMDKYRQCIIQTRLFNYEGERSTKSTCAMPLMLNMLNVVWSQARRFPTLCDMSLSYKARVSAVWKRHDDLVQVSGNLGFLLSSKKPLIAFAPDNEVKDTEKQSLNNLELIAPVFDLQQVASNVRTDTGLYPGSPYQHVHTLVIVNTEKHWSEEDRCAQGLMFTFARLVAQATHLHGDKIGKPLDQPLSAHCVISDGFRLSFICFQLNTLEFSTDEGIKNIAWIVPGVQMYDRVLLEGTTPKYSKAQVEGFNENCFEIFSKIMMNRLSHA